MWGNEGRETEAEDVGAAPRPALVQESDLIFLELPFIPTRKTAAECFFGINLFVWVNTDMFGVNT